MNTHEARLGTDFVRGMGLWRRQTQSQLQSWTTLVTTGLVAGLLVGVLFLLWRHEPYRLVAVPTWYLARVLVENAHTASVSLPVWTSGGWQGWLPAAIVNDAWFAANAARVTQSLLPALGVAVGTMLVIVVGGVVTARRLGRRARTLHRFRGRHNLLLTGPCGVGKSWLACALGERACREDVSVAYHRLPRLLAALALARGDGRHARLLRSLGRVELLILDDWGPEQLDAEQRRDLLEIVEDRYDRRSTIVTSQAPVEAWYDIIGNPTIADAMLDRLVHNAYRIELRGESLRRRTAKTSSP